MAIKWVINFPSPTLCVWAGSLGEDWKHHWTDDLNHAAKFDTAESALFQAYILNAPIPHEARAITNEP